ncbi:MAG TPA: alpha/beta fold hydrolase [Bellilinea sp.]|nr:alpha/beta fold hydrolase [Bellilinea sp.]
MPTYLIWILVAIVVLIVLYLALGYHFGKKIVRPLHHDWEFLRDYEIEEGRLTLDRYKQVLPDEVHFASPHGEMLTGLWLPGIDPNHTVVLVHGIENNSIGMLKFAKPFQQLGWNVFIFDQRGNGRSGGRFISYGWFERNDLRAAYDWVLARTSPDNQIGTLGMSMGATSALMHAAIDPRVKFVVADSAYADATDEILYQFHQQYKGIPEQPLVPAGLAWANLLGGFKLKDVNLLPLMPKLAMPVFFIHSLEDEVTPPANSQKLFFAKSNGESELWMVPEAKHVRAINVIPDEYAARIHGFLKKNNLV